MDSHNRIRRRFRIVFNTESMPCQDSSTRSPNHNAECGQEWSTDEEKSPQVALIVHDLCNSTPVGPEVWKECDHHGRWVTGRRGERQNYRMARSHVFSSKCEHRTTQSWHTLPLGGSCSQDFNDVLIETSPVGVSMGMSSPKCYHVNLVSLSAAHSPWGGFVAAGIPPLSLNPEPGEGPIKPYQGSASPSTLA